MPTKKSGLEFKEWASLFSGKLFVKVVAYVDESGTHDITGASPGSGEVVIAGLVARPNEWEKFCDEWRGVLNKYAVDYFHFKEWTAAYLVKNGTIKPFKDFRKNPYQRLECSDLDSFVLELAEIAGHGNKPIVGGWVNTAQFHQAKTGKNINSESVPAGGSPYQHCLNRFFENLPNDILSAWPDWNEPVSIFYDWTEDPKWKHAIIDAHDLARKKDPRIKELTFANKKEPGHLPLQAADMVAYRFRRLAEGLNKGTLPVILRKLDAVLVQQFGFMPRPV